MESQNVFYEGKVIRSNFEKLTDISVEMKRILPGMGLRTFFCKVQNSAEEVGGKLYAKN